MNLGEKSDTASRAAQGSEAGEDYNNVHGSNPLAALVQDEVQGPAEKTEKVSRFSLVDATFFFFNVK
jgi:hypothetical protein